MESTSSPDNGRQSRGLARFWPVHGMPAPGQRQSGEDGADEDADAARATSGDAPAAAQPPVSDVQPAAGPFGPGALTSDPQMVALGSRRPPEVLNGGRPWNQGGFPPTDAERGFRNGDGAPRHGGAPIPNGVPPTAGTPLPGSGLPSSGSGLPGSGSGLPGSGLPGSGLPGSGLPAARTPFTPASPFAPHVAARGAAAASGETSPPPAAGAARPTSGDSVAAQHSWAGEGAAESPGTRPRNFDVPTSRGAASVPVPGQAPGRDVSVVDGTAFSGSKPGPGETQSNGPIALGGPVAANGRVDLPAPRPAAGWASVPTSGVPTITNAGNVPVAGAAPTVRPADAAAIPIAGSSVIGSPASGSPDAAAPASGFPTSGPPTSGFPTSSPPTSGSTTSSPPTPGSTTSSPPTPGSTTFGPTASGSPASGSPAEALAGGARRAREEQIEGRPAARRSTSLDDADPLPRSRRVTAESDRRGDAGDGSADSTVGRRAGDVVGGGTTAPDLDAETQKPKTKAASRSDAPMRPGDVVEIPIAFWDDEAVAHFRGQWHEVKADFVDDPVAALTRAHDLLTEAVNELTESLLAERDELDPLQSTSTPDTESMRMAMRGYREFLDRILAL